MSVSFSYTMQTTDPAEIVKSIRSEVQRRLEGVQSRTARTKVEGARQAGAAAELESLVRMLSNIEFNAAMTNAHSPTRAPHITMTPEEYRAYLIKGWHEVCRDVDGFGGVGIRFLGEGSHNIEFKEVPL